MIENKVESFVTSICFIVIGYRHHKLVNFTYDMLLLFEHVLLVFQSMKLPAYLPDSCSEAEKPENRAKNRYRNILPCMLKMCFLIRMFTYCISEEGNAIGSIHLSISLSVLPFVLLCLLSRVTFHHLHVYVS